MTKNICLVCGYIHEGDTELEVCPQCKAPVSKFKLMGQSDLAWADEHRVGIAEGIDAEILENLRSSFAAQSTEAGIYLAMSRQADREGFPETSEVYRRIAHEKAEHAAKFAELLGEKVFDDTKKNLQLSLDAEFEECEREKRVATKAKQLGLDAVHDTVHEICKDRARHGCALKGLLDRYFK
ncbi:MAG: NADH peroxidase [Oscillospiraceae bacterium]|nr:NADH peroxidase [Oscillospiraceae bacterium]